MQSIAADIGFYIVAGFGLFCLYLLYVLVPIAFDKGRKMRLFSRKVTQDDLDFWVKKLQEAQISEFVRLEERLNYTNTRVDANKDKLSDEAFSQRIELVVDEYFDDDDTAEHRDFMDGPPEWLREIAASFVEHASSLHERMGGFESRQSQISKEVNVLMGSIASVGRELEAIQSKENPQREWLISLVSEFIEKGTIEGMKTPHSEGRTEGAERERSLSDELEHQIRYDLFVELGRQVELLRKESAALIKEQVKQELDESFEAPVTVKMLDKRIAREKKSFDLQFWEYKQDKVGTFAKEVVELAQQNLTVALVDSYHKSLSESSQKLAHDQNNIKQTMRLLADEIEKYREIIGRIMALCDAHREHFDGEIENLPELLSHLRKIVYDLAKKDSTVCDKTNPFGKPF